MIKANAFYSKKGVFELSRGRYCKKFSGWQALRLPFSNGLPMKRTTFDILHDPLMQTCSIQELVTFWTSTSVASPPPQSSSTVYIPGHAAPFATTEMIMLRKLYSALYFKQISQTWPFIVDDGVYHFLGYL